MLLVISCWWLLSLVEMLLEKKLVSMVVRGAWCLVRTFNCPLLSALCFLLFTLCLPQFALSFTAYSLGSPKKEQITILDTIEFDGEEMKFSYSLDTDCPAETHDTVVTLYANTKMEKNKKQLDTISIEITDIVEDTSECEKTKTIQKSVRINLRDLVEDKISEIKRKNVTVDETYDLILPRLRLYKDNWHTNYSGIKTKPDKPEKGNYEPVNLDVYFQKIKEKGKVDISRKFYEALWHCKLWKKDGSRRDGFDGYGKTVKTAKDEAISGCNSTGNPLCRQFANDSQHTNCEFTVEAKTESQEYALDDAKMPNLKTAKSQWNCYMYAKGSGKISSGVSDSEEKTRQNLAAECDEKNIKWCDKAAFSPDYSICNASIAVEEPKPIAQWRCKLWKKDGARKDGFEGTGSSEAEARNRAASACKSTNHPKCNDFAVDSSHTTCEVELVYEENK